MAARQASPNTTKLSGQAFLAIGCTALFGGLLQEASTLMCRLCCCLIGELVRVAIWAVLAGGRAIVAHLLDFDRVVVCYQWLASVGPLLHCLFLAR
jgi:hypothetical protein